VFLTTVLLAAACSDANPRRSAGRHRDRSADNAVVEEDQPRQEPRNGSVSQPRSAPPGFLLASSFEQPICGFWWRPRPGCEFGAQGVDTTTTAELSRTGESSLRIQRMTPSHQGVIADVPLPDGHGFIGVASRVPEIPAGAIPSFGRRAGNVQLLQLSPTDGVVPGMPVEVRLFDDRRLGLGLFKDKTTTVMSDWSIPVDEWFYIVVEVNNGVGAPQRMLLYDSSDRLVDRVVAHFDTRQVWAHQGRSAHKVGGNTSTSVPMYTYHDDWYVATELKGPVRITRSGAVLDG